MNLSTRKRYDRFKWLDFYIDYCKANPLSWIGALMVLIGGLIIGFAVSWWGALGVFIFVTGNNFEQASRRLR